MVWACCNSCQWDDEIQFRKAGDNHRILWLIGFSSSRSKVNLSWICIFMYLIGQRGTLLRWCCIALQQKYESRNACIVTTLCVCRGVCHAHVELWAHQEAVSQSLPGKERHQQMLLFSLFSSTPLSNSLVFFPSQSASLSLWGGKKLLPAPLSNWQIE